MMLEEMLVMLGGAVVDMEMEVMLVVMTIVVVATYSSPGVVTVDISHATITSETAM